MSFLYLLLVVTSSAVTIYVNDALGNDVANDRVSATPTNPFKSIQAALDASISGMYIDTYIGLLSKLTYYVSLFKVL